MRDRLIELLGGFPIWHSTMKEIWMPEAVDRLADHLLANGVIVPPYKPLPLVWPDDEFAQEVLCPICETDLMGCYIDGEEAPTVITCYHCGAWLDSTKAVTRDEAEKALAEREGDDG